MKGLMLRAVSVIASCPHSLGNHIFPSIASWTSKACTQPSFGGAATFVDSSRCPRFLPAAQVVLGPLDPSSLSASVNMDPLTITAREIRDLLDAGRTTSVEVVKLFLDQIEKHNLNGMKVRAVISTPPREQVLAYARKLDDERAAKGSRGPMHGIPILVKVIFPLTSFRKNPVALILLDAGHYVYPFSGYGHNLRLLCFGRSESFPRC